MEPHDRPRRAEAPKRFPFGIFVLLIVVVGAGLVVVATASGGQYALDISAIVEAPAKFENQKVRVLGTIADGSTKSVATGGKTETHFAIVDDKAHRLNVVFREAVPDAYKEGRSCIAEGVIQADGSLLCTRLTVKCPSKYQEEGKGVGGSASNEMGYGGAAEAAN